MTINSRKRRRRKEERIVWFGAPSKSISSIRVRRKPIVRFRFILREINHISRWYVIFSLNFFADMRFSRVRVCSYVIDPWIDLPSVGTGNFLFFVIWNWFRLIYCEVCNYYARLVCKDWSWGFGIELVFFCSLVSIICGFVLWSLDFRFVNGLCEFCNLGWIQLNFDNVSDGKGLIFWISNCITLFLQSTLAAARADNFYYPPEWEPKKGGLNKFNGQHALRERAKKIDQGILVIRY